MAHFLKEWAIPNNVLTLFSNFQGFFSTETIARFKPWPALATLPQSRSKMTKHIAPNQTVLLFFTANSVSVKRMTQLRACFCLNWQNRLLVLFSVLNSNHSFSFPTHGSTNYYQLLQISKLQQKVVLCDHTKFGLLSDGVTFLITLQPN